MSRSACLWVNVRTIRCAWSPWGLRWPSPEVLVDAASGCGDNYSIPDLAHDTRQKSNFLRKPALLTAVVADTSKRHDLVTGRAQLREPQARNEVRQVERFQEGRRVFVFYRLVGLDDPLPKSEPSGAGDLGTVIEFPGSRQENQELRSPLIEVLDASRRAMTVLTSNPINTSELRLQLRKLDELLTTFSSTVSQSFAEAGASGNRVYTLREQTRVLLAILRKVAESETAEPEDESNGAKLELLEKQLSVTLRELLEEWDKTAAPPSSSS
jgi:hypothetical protein